MPSTPIPFFRRPRYVYAAAAFGLGAIDSTAAMLLGIDFRLGGRDVTWLVGAFLEISFAGFGYLIGVVVEARRNERQAAAKIQSQLEQLAATRERLARHEKLASLGQLASTVAHEVRNPLAIIRSLVQSLEERIPGSEEESLESCRVIREEIDRLSRVVTSLVGFSKPLQLRKSEVAATAIVERTELLAQRMLKERSIRLETNGGNGRRARVRADGDLLCQVLLGLLANAAEATPDGGSIHLGWRRHGASVEFAVTDQGPGVPEHIREQIFDPFFTTRPDGSGLGLAVAQQIVEAHGGHIEVETSQGSGARFFFRLADTHIAA